MQGHLYSTVGNNCQREVLTLQTGKTNPRKNREILSFHTPDKKHEAQRDYFRGLQEIHAKSMHCIVGGSSGTLADSIPTEPPVPSTFMREILAF